VAAQRLTAQLSEDRTCNAQSCRNPPTLRRNVYGQPTRWAVSNGDPHTTNFFGDYYHMQMPGIYTMVKTDDGLFEVQIYQDGYYRPGTPSYVREVRIRYRDQVYHESFNRDGFYVHGYGQMIVAVPGGYTGHVMGACGGTSSPGPQNFKDQHGNIVDVKWRGGGGAQAWGLSGYGGPNTGVSRFQASWKPTMQDCLFGASRCQQNLQRTFAHRGGCVVWTPWGRVNMCAYA